ncbi:MAG TPA: hypothetical protein VHX12_02285 [Acidisoma sp.]|nr:hypothetical protein [Acidisoma sp.]
MRDLCDRDHCQHIYITCGRPDEQLGLILHNRVVALLGAPPELYHLDTSNPAPLQPRLVVKEVRRAGGPLIHLSGCAKGRAHPGPAAITLVGEDGRLNLVRDGRPGDPPIACGLALAEIPDLPPNLPA